MNNNTNAPHVSREKPRPFLGKADHFACGTAAALAALLVTGTPALGAPPVPASQPRFVLPAGTACEFTLIIDTVSTNPVKQFTDKNGLLVRMIEAGKGGQLTFSTDINDSVYVIKPNGSVNQTTFGRQERSFCLLVFEKKPSAGQCPV